jgi:hypothetical protein
MGTDFGDLTRGDVSVDLLLVHPDRHSVDEHMTDAHRLIRRQTLGVRREIGDATERSWGNRRWVEDDDVGPCTDTEFSTVNQMKKVGL